MADASNTAAGRYESLVAERAPVLQRARECAALTIPALLPPEGASGATELYSPFQSTGADGVNNLASKLLLTLFPPGASFVRFKMDDFTLDALLQKAGANAEQAQADFEAAFGKIERALVSKMEATGSRTVNFEVLQHLIVAGNGLVFVMKDGREKFFPLDRYVVKRDLDDNLLEIVVRECVSKSALDPRAKALMEANPDKDSQDDTRSLDVYTWIRREESGSGWHWVSHQEICGLEIPDTHSTYPQGESAWIPLRWRKVPGNDYGRGRCEEYLGDLRSFEVLSKAVIMFAAAASKVLFLVDESGTTDKERLAEADSGDFLDGNAKDVTTVQLEKSQDFAIANGKAEEIRQRLERAFLMASAVQRQAERVTAEEIRAMIGELEQSLGGVYSILAEEFQRPLVIVLKAKMEKAGELPAMPKGAVSPQIITGLDGLGRSSDLQRLDMFIAGAEQQFGQQFLAQWVNIGNYLQRRATALGIDLTGLIRTQEEIDAQNQAAQRQAMVEKLGPAGIKAISDHTMPGKGTPLPGPTPQ